MRTNAWPISNITGHMPRTAITFTTPSRLPLAPLMLTGIEVEAEAVDINDRRFFSASGWDTHNDASLRNGVEFVLSSPLGGENLGSAIDGLYDHQDVCRFAPSPRAGTHIHINVSDKTWGTVQVIFALIYCLDRVLFNWAGVDRMWCSYCNSLNTMPLDSIVRLLQNGEHPYVPSLWSTGANDRYYGLNVASVWKHGTLEFRHFPTTTNKEELWSWVDFCHAVSMYADEVVAQHDPNSEASIVEAVLRDASQPEILLLRIFDKAPAVLEGLTSEEGWQQHISSAAEELELLLSADFMNTDHEYEHDPAALCAPEEFPTRPAIIRREAAWRDLSSNGDATTMGWGWPLTPEYLSNGAAIGEMHN